MNTKEYLLVYAEPEVKQYSSIEQLMLSLPGIFIKNRYVDPIEGCMLFRLSSDFSGIALMKAFIEEAGKLEKVELFEWRSMEW